MKARIHNVKKQMLLWMTAILVACFILPGSMPVSAAAKYHLSRTKTSLYIGDTETLALLPLSPKQEKEIVWSSSRKKIVTVSKGKIMAKKAGKATITAKYSGKTYRCKVTVKEPKEVYVEVPAPVEPKAPAAGNQFYQNDVSQQMTTAAYWCKKTEESDTVLMTQEEIASQNSMNMNSADTGMRDLKNSDVQYNSENTKQALINELMSDVRENRIGSRETIYRNGIALDVSAIDAWFGEMKANIENAQTSEADTKKYGICVKRADLWMAPANDIVGWSETDPDSEFINSALNVNEPVLINFTTADGKYCHVSAVNCSGWVEADHFAICATKEEWLNQWDLSSENVLVVVGSHIVLEQSNLAPNTSALDLYLGTQLPLAPKDAIPANIAERLPWYSYCVYIPIRGDDGMMKREIALISSHHEVNIGFPEMTQKNILDIAFSCLGDRYGWGGMLGAMDCSLYVRNIYRCFGLEIPRNTTWQEAMPAHRLDLSSMDSKTKQEAISELPPGSLLFFPGHVMMYLGMDNDKLYVISDLGSLAESEGELDVKSIYSVCINSLNVRRRSGNTWLDELTSAVCPFQKEEKI